MCPCEGWQVRLVEVWCCSDGHGLDWPGTYSAVHKYGVDLAVRK